MSGQNSKINGVSFVSSRVKIDSTHTKPVVTTLGANYATVMPFGFVSTISTPEIAFNGRRQWVGERRAGAKQYALALREQNLKIMIKPQLWIARGQYTGFINMTTEDDWSKFETSYTAFILEYAELAQEINAPLFCIGTELENFVKMRPAYWTSLIKKIKTIYKGQLTYAANWDEFKRTPFWSELDYIGIDAYFPVSEEQTPTIEACIEGWKTHKAVIKEYALKYNKPILFTEYGYRSVDFSGKEPWRSDRELNQVNMQAQVNTTKALYETFWDEDWFAGGFIWKWFYNYSTSGGESNSQFTPQNKPVEAVIKQYYKQYSK
ncbi:glycoside hydrolase family 113 [Winogradskyella immobilis]|nr:glycoside hydrolase [Winogradskyella immobilis]MCG0015231.1 glycoside hydrolase [Winogradskyella immobilis]